VDKFLVFMCPKCGRIQSAITRQTDIFKVNLKCRNERCKKTSRLKNKKTGNFKVNVWFCKTEKEAAEKVLEMNKS